MIVSAKIDERELKSLIKDLESLNMSDSKNKTLLRQGMRKAAKPLVPQIRKEIDNYTSKTKNSRSTGQLKKSIAIINGKNVRNRPPTVFVGPRVKGAYADMKKTGFYFYFLEYGFRGKPGGRMLDKAATSQGNTTLNSVIKEIKKLIDKRMK